MICQADLKREAKLERRKKLRAMRPRKGFYYKRKDDWLNDLFYVITHGNNSMHVRMSSIKRSEPFWLGLDNFLDNYEEYNP